PCQLPLLWFLALELDSRRPSTSSTPLFAEERGGPPLADPGEYLRPASFRSFGSWLLNLIPAAHQLLQPLFSQKRGVVRQRRTGVSIYALPASHSFSRPGALSALCAFPAISVV